MGQFKSRPAHNVEIYFDDKGLAAINSSTLGQQWPAVLDVAVLRAFVELDAYSFGTIVNFECNKTFNLSGVHLISREHGRSIINNSVYTLIADNSEFIHRYANNDLFASAMCLYYLKSFEEKYGKRPFIDWFEIPPAELQNMISPLWHEAGYEPPFAGELGATNIQILSDTIAAYPGVDALIRDVNAVFPKTGRSARIEIKARM